MRPYSPNWRTSIIELFVQEFKDKELNEMQAEIEQWWSNSDARFALILGGERGGKSWLAALLAAMCMNLDKPGEYWVVGPDYQQARQEFLYLYNAFKNGFGGISFLLPETVSMPVSIANPWSFTTIWGQTWRTRSASDIQKLASFSVSGVIMAEAAQQIYEAYLKLMGRVSETGGFLILSGTLERGLPWYSDLYKRWQGENELGARSFSVPTWSNTAVYPGGRDNPRIKELEAEYPEDLFMERFGAQPARKMGLVIPEFDFTKHVKHLELDESKPVELWTDPATHCYPVLFVQLDGLTTNVLDCVYARNSIAQDVIPQVMANPLFKYVDLNQAGVMDTAGKQHQANKSQIELWQEIAGCYFRTHYWRLDDTIQALRFRLREFQGSPLIYFNSHLKNTKSPDGLAMDVLAEFELWAWPDRGLGRNQPVTPIDRNNDACKALGYGLLDHFGTNITRKTSPRGRRRDYFV
jgi:hypothetical protein